MSETAQVVIAASITILTIILSLVGIQIIFVLKEFRKIFEKTNMILDETHDFTSRVSHSLDSFSGTLEGVKAALSIIGLLKKKKKEEEE